MSDDSFVLVAGHRRQRTRAPAAVPAASAAVPAAPLSLAPVGPPSVVANWTDRVYFPLLQFRLGDAILLRASGTFRTTRERRRPQDGRHVTPHASRPCIPCSVLVVTAGPPICARGRLRPATMPRALHSPPIGTRCSSPTTAASLGALSRATAYRSDCACPPRRCQRELPPPYCAFLTRFGRAHLGTLNPHWPHATRRAG